MSRISGPGPGILVAVVVHAAIFVTTMAALDAAGSLDVGAVEWSHRYYASYAAQALQGRLPYRDFAFEYPPLSFPLFLIPGLFAADFGAFRIAFLAEMFLLDVAAIVLVACLSREAPYRRLSWYTLYCLLLAPLVIGRFELAPMVLAFAASRWWHSGRAVAGGIVAATGTLMKVFPGAVAVPAMASELFALRRAGSPPRGMFAFAGCLTLGLIAWLWLAGGTHNFLESVRYHGGRGLEVESVPGSVLLLAGALQGNDVPWVFDHNAYHLDSTIGDTLAQWTIPLQIAAMLAVATLNARFVRTDGMLVSTTSILAFTVFGKVLSPQYLIWLFPFLAVLEGPAGQRSRQLFLIACLATAILYPGPGFRLVLEHQKAAIVLLVLRNGLLLWLLMVLVQAVSRGESAGCKG